MKNKDDTKTLKISKLALVAGGLLTVLVLGLLFFWEPLTTRYQTSEIARQQFTGPKGLMASPVEGSYLGIGEITPTSPASVAMSSKQPVEPDGFSLLFLGNLHAVSAYIAQDFDASYQLVDGSWHLLAEVRDYKFPTYQVTLPKRTPVTGFVMVLKKAPFSNQVEMGNVHFFTKEKVSLIAGLQDIFGRYQKSLLAYFLYPLFFSLLIYISGYTLVHQLNKRLKNQLDPEEILIFGTAVYLGILAALAVLFIFTGFIPILYLFLLISFVCLFLFLKDRLYHHFRQLKFIFGITLAALLIMTMAQAKRDFLDNLPYVEPYYDVLNINQLPLSGGFYGYHADNLRPWFISRFFLSQASLSSDAGTAYLKSIGDTSIFERTPLLAIISMPILQVFGTSHFIYQRFLSVLICLYLLAVYLFLRNYFSKPAAQITIMLFILKPALIFETYAVEIYLKYFAMFPVFLASVLLVKESPGRFLLMGCLLAAGVLIHPMVLILIVAWGLLFLKRYGINRKLVINSVQTFTPVLITVAIWWFTSHQFSFDLPAGERDRVANLYVNKILSLSPQLLVDKFINLINIFIPDVLLRSHESFWSRTYLFVFMRNSLIATLTPILFIFGAWHLTKVNLRRYGTPLWLVAGPVIVNFLLLHEYSLGGFESLYIFILPILLGFVIQQLLIKNLWIRKILIISYTLTMAVVLYFNSGVFITTMRYSNPMITALFWGLILTFVLISCLCVRLAALKTDEE